MFRRNKTKGAKQAIFAENKLDEESVALTDSCNLDSSSEDVIVKETTKSKGGRFIPRKLFGSGGGGSKKSKTVNAVDSSSTANTSIDAETASAPLGPAEMSVSFIAADEAVAERRVAQPDAETAPKNSSFFADFNQLSSPTSAISPRMPQPSRRHGNSSSLTSSAESSDVGEEASRSHGSLSDHPQSLDLFPFPEGGGALPPIFPLTQRMSKVSVAQLESYNSGMKDRTRSGWSIYSGASTAVNSENYIQSLDELPMGTDAANPFRAGKSFPVLNAQSDGKIREALSRSFGRNHPPATFSERWTVRVSDAKWDSEEGRHKYKINLTKSPVPARGNSGTGNDDFRVAAGVQSSFNSATTTRSLQDFVWLEQALRAEYHGALLVPLLSLALYFKNTSDGADDEASSASHSLTSDATSEELLDNLPPVTDGNMASASLIMLDEKMDRNEAVNNNVLANWLSDILNGVRGHGEVILLTHIDVVESEAMETFLFRHSEPLKGVSPSKMGKGNNQCRASNLGSPVNLFSIGRGEGNVESGWNKSIFESFIENPLICFSTDNTCSGCGTGEESREPEEITVRTPSKPLPLTSMMCSSGATGVRGIKHCGSDLSRSTQADKTFAWLQASSSNIATHSELLEAERDLIASYIRSSTSAIIKQQSLARDEAYVGQCWKRFAISLSNLFAVEKDLETAHIGDQIKSNKKKQPFRKVRKSAVNDGLRSLARRKMERSKPSLQSLGGMLNAYFADLNSVVPAFKEYTDAINQLQKLEEVRTAQELERKESGKKINETSQNNGSDWQHQFEQLKALTSNKLIDITKQITGVSSQTAATTKSTDSEPSFDDEFFSLNTNQAKALQSRVLSNEKMLKFSVTLLLKACPLRNARMAWLYFKTEAKLASNVHGAATSLRQTLSIDADTAIAMKERRYGEDEKVDNEAELNLVKRIFELGAHNFSNIGAQDVDEVPGLDTSEETEARRQNAIRLVKERAGRWNSEAALAIMEAAGVGDAEVQMDETSRELRHVRKYAISLRENVRKCLEAAEALAETIIPGTDNPVQISRSRREFWASITTLFSGILTTDDGHAYNVSNVGTPSTRVLSSVGIDASDRGGWLGHSQDVFNQRTVQRRKCGDSARRYLRKRDNQANVLISRVLKLLKDYERRLEGIESFVYMHCVGIQLEKHCSKIRSKALAAWEKRTDISTAIMVATKKKIPKLVQELKRKLDGLPQVSHTTVIKAKECHLASKTLKSDLHKLANRRFGRAQEVSTERVIAIMSLWAKHEESVAIEEVKALGEAVQEVELSIHSADVDVAIDRYSLVHDNGALHPEGGIPPEGRTLLI